MPKKCNVNTESIMLANSLCFEKVLTILVEGFSLVKTGNTFHDSDTKLINLKI